MAEKGRCDDETDDNGYDERPKQIEVWQYECEGGCTEDRKENDVFSSVPVAEEPSEQSPYGQCREKSE